MKLAVAFVLFAALAMGAPCESLAEARQSGGGKPLIYHGWSDPGIPPSNSVNYYRSVTKATPGDSVQLFMVPGMGHCGGGDGTSTFDMVAAVNRWVDMGMPRAAIPASKVVDGTVVRTRPLYPFPAVAAYKGTGSSDEAANFVCR